MDKRPHIKPYLYAMLAGFGAISLSILLFFLIYRFRGLGDAVAKLADILMPFIYGGAIAYALKPVCNFLERNLKKIVSPRFHRVVGPFAVTGSLLFGLLLVYALLLMIIPQLYNSILTLSSTLPARLDTLVNWLSGQYFADHTMIQNFLIEVYDALAESFGGWINNTLIPYMQDIVSGVGQSVWNAVIALKNLLIGLFVAAYLLASRRRFAQQAKILLYGVLPSRWSDLILEELAYADRMFGGFINGKLLDSAIIGLLCYVVCILVNFPSAMLVSAIVGITNVIPFFGPFIGAVPATLLILIEDPIKAIWFVLFILILQQLDGNVIGPKILGNTTGLSSFWVLFSILLFGGLWGFVGMIVGVPLFAVIYDVLRKLIIHGLRANGQEAMLIAYHDAFGGSEDPGSAPKAPQ